MRIAHNRKNYEGMVVGRITIGALKEVKNQKTYWTAICVCGNTYTIASTDMWKLKGYGCKDCAKISHQSHGLSRSRIYRIWVGMKQRCLGGHHTYKNYGGRGISICEQWLDFEIFNKWAMENGYTSSLTIERNDVNGNYEPSNCRWATMKEQNDNKRTSHFLEINGVLKTLSQWSKEYNISPNTVTFRLNKGYTPLQALSEPPSRSHSSKPQSS